MVQHFDPDSEVARTVGTLPDRLGALADDVGKRLTVVERSAKKAHERIDDVEARLDEMERGES